MKMLKVALFISLALASGIALAERGSDVDNRISYPDSTTAQDDGDTRNSSPSEIVVRNP